MSQWFPCDFIADVSPRFPGDALTMNKRDRDAVLNVALATRQPINSIVEQTVVGTHVSSETERKRVRIELYEHGKIDSLCGVLFDHLDVLDATGTRHKIQFINPFALLAVAAATILDLFRLIQAMLQNAGGQKMRFVIYHGGVVPGNNLRPDDGRAFVFFFVVNPGDPSMDENARTDAMVHYVVHHEESNEVVGYWYSSNHEGDVAKTIRFIRRLEFRDHGGFL